MKKKRLKQEFPLGELKKLFCIMKLVFFFLLLSSNLVWAGQTYAQITSLNLDLNNVSLEEVFDAIRKQSEFEFFYNNDQINTAVKVSVKAKNADIYEVLEQALPKNYEYKINDRYILVNKRREVAPVLSAQPQQQTKKTIIGTVTDKDGEAIIGANIVEKGTNNGTVTDIDGKFSLNVENNAVLLISYIGYLPQEISTIGQNVLSTVLQEDTKKLDEVVVIGYGTVRKSDLTGSVSSVKGEELTAMPQVSVAQSLQGRSAGVHVKQTNGAPGGATTVRIRGTNSILGGNAPLYVIDGFPSNSSDPTMLDVTDIESIEILKDASAIAIYGSRGSNGVIMITTKKGKAGKTKVDFGTTLGFQSLAKKMEMMNAQEYAMFYNIRAINDGQAPFFTQSEIDTFGKGFDWQDFVFTTAPIRTHSLTISGGSEKTKFAISGNIFDQEGIVGKGGYDRYSFRMNLDHEISKRMTMNVSSTLSRSILDDKNSSGGRQGGSLISVALVGPPILSPYNEDGTYTVLDNSYPFITTGGALINPLNILNERSDKTKWNNVLANLSFTYEPIDGLFIKILGGVENSDSRNDYYQSLNFYNSLGNASVSTAQTISYLNENTISYIRDFGKHGISAVAGFTYQDYERTSLGGSGTGFLSDIIETGNLGSAATPGIPSSSYSKWVLLSSIARVNYKFDNRYLFTLSFRADGSSRYSEGDKWGYFPSGALAWRISEEQFMENVSLISDLKLRTSYGVTGSQAISAYSTLNNLSSGKTVFGNERVTYFTPYANLPGRLKWESTAQFDLGMDIGILDNKFRFTADYYIKDTRDLLNTIQLPTSSGYTSTQGNVGKVQNKGFEFSFDAHTIDREFQWILNGNISFNRSKVIKLYGGEDILGGSIDFMVINDNSNLLREGEPMGIFYGYVQDGYDTNGTELYKDLNGDGIINQEDKTKIGDPNPKFIYGLNSHMSYKGFELSLFLQGSHGNDLLNASRIDNSLYYMYGLNQVREVLYDHWTPENPNAKYPKPVTGLSMRLSNRLIENGSYLRLKNVELSYNLPVRKWDISWLEKVRLYVSLQNMFTITNYSGWDPDVNSQGGGLGQGIDHNPYPIAKSYTFGINVSF